MSDRGATVSFEPEALDAKVLAYAVNADAPNHAASRALLKAVLAPIVNEILDAEPAERNASA
jgi:hypothetical protein